MEILLAIVALLLLIGVVSMTYNRGPKRGPQEEESWTLDSAEDNGGGSES